MMSEDSYLKELYKETILQYSNRKDVKRLLAEPDFSERGHNPNCGDDITLLVKFEGDRVKEVSYVGEGCAISKASTAILIDRMQGKNIAEAREQLEIFFRMMGQKQVPETEREKLGDALLLESAAGLPARVKCATLSWHTMEIILEKHWIASARKAKSDSV